MKKILMLVAGVSIASVSFAASNFTDGGATGSTTKLSVDGTGTGVTGTCQAIAVGEIVTVALSKQNIGSYSCSSTAAGVAIASTKGKAKVYRSGSGGGAVIEAACAGDPCTATDTGSATTGSDKALADAS